jgi:carbamoyltransferase
MNVLGLTGGLDRVWEHRSYLVPNESAHDAAAVLVRDGSVVAAVEEERLNRIKHTSKAPIGAIQYCMREAGIRAKDLDRIAFYGDEAFLDGVVRRRYFNTLTQRPIRSIRSHALEMLETALGEAVSDEKVFFIPHHLTHAVSAFAVSGFQESLIVTMDGSGDEYSSLILTGQKDVLTVVHALPTLRSLGYFYLLLIRFLGFAEFEEYKVMGLAPYGDASKYAGLISRLYTLHPNGEYELFLDRARTESNFDRMLDFVGMLSEAMAPRRKGEPIQQAHKDLAASIQQALEEIILHVLQHYRSALGFKQLCLAGGVAHNCSANGKLLCAQLFENVFVQPASHDAGCALGAALVVERPTQNQIRFQRQNPRLEHVYWGPDLSADVELRKTLESWRPLIRYRHRDDIAAYTAQEIARGSIVGWVQGRSEFGPRALGNRSILADPRPEENRTIINDMVKKRESYRPFAPSVLEDYAESYFELPGEEKSFPFMTFVVKVREEKRRLLGATTHVDGTARIQTVSRSVNPRYWDLIDCFRKLTGVPVLLNTSFNNNVEPIVDSPDDAIVCFLSTTLSLLVIGDYVIERDREDDGAFLQCVPSLAPYSKLRCEKKLSDSGMQRSLRIGRSYTEEYDRDICDLTYDILTRADGRQTLHQLLGGGDWAEPAISDCATELRDLWSLRLIVLQPHHCEIDQSLEQSSCSAEDKVPVCP